MYVCIIVYIRHDVTRSVLSFSFSAFRNVRSTTLAWARKLSENVEIYFFHIFYFIFYLSIWPQSEKIRSKYVGSRYYQVEEALKKVFSYIHHLLGWRSSLAANPGMTFFLEVPMQCRNLSGKFSPPWLNRSSARQQYSVLFWCVCMCVCLCLQVVQYKYRVMHRTLTIHYRVTPGRLGLARFIIFALAPSSQGLIVKNLDQRLVFSVL